MAELIGDLLLALLLVLGGFGIGYGLAQRGRRRRP